MKRLFFSALMLCFLFFGCGKEIDETIPNEMREEKSCVTIRIAEEKTDFDSFTAAAPEPAEAGWGRELVEAVLAEYPDGFAQQWGRVEVLLVAELTGVEGFAGGRWAGFTQRTGSGWQLVLDVNACDAGTVHHELAHILDGILTEAGVLTVEEWMAYCPDGFRYGAGDWERYPDFFTDSYAMENMKEDRARTFEEAVLGGPGVYEEKPALWLKLHYFSNAIREYFDTTGWPEKTIWELGLE